MKHPTARASASQYRKYPFTYRYDGADWSIEIPALSLDEAKERIKVLGFARYEGEAAVRPARPTVIDERRTSGWFRAALRSA